MEALHQDARLLKENVEAATMQPSKLRAVSTGDNAAKPTLTKRAFAIHSDTSKTSTGKKGLSDAPPEKRRALGDISNRHRNRRNDDAGDTVAATRIKKSLKSVRKSDVRKQQQNAVTTTGVAKAKAKSSVRAQPPLSKSTHHKPPVDNALASKPTTQLLPVDEVEDIEHAYGGLPSLAPDADYLARLRNELVRDLVTSKTQSLVDDYEPTDAFGGWHDDDARQLLESGDAPSRWWSQPATEHADATSELLWHDDDDAGDDVTRATSLLDDVPAPDDFADTPLYDESDDVFDELLNADIDAACH